jgi:hypothetical protein
MCSGESDWTCLQPGFPIRKSSDHSLVIDSPRLIADSYVLHRFLVPRHPPCALKNLSHKDARVHCVVLKKRAAPHPTRRLPHHPVNGARHGGSTASEGPKPHSNGPKVSAFARPLRTQQRARHHLPTTRVPRPTPTGRASTDEAAGQPAPTNRCSTLEHPLPHTRGQTGLWIACATSAP